MTIRVIGKGAWVALLCGLVSACANLPSAPTQYYDEQDFDPPVTYTPMVEYPPVEPIEPPLPLPPPAGLNAAPAASASVPPAVAAPNVVAMLPQQRGLPPAGGLPAAPVSPSPAPDTPTDDQQLIALLGDLQRYGLMSADDVKRELANATAALSRQRTDINRVRLAVLYTSQRSNPQDDQRAMQLLDNVARNPAGSPAVKQLAVILQVQIAERFRAVRDEQLKADAAVQKLEALRQMERSLIRDRTSSGSGGGGGGGGSGGGGGGGGGR